MLYILLMILKILGILLAVILGLLILIGLIVLFVPVRYEIKVIKKEDLVVHAKVHWLLRAVFMKIWLLDQKLHVRLRILGYIFYDNLRPKREKKKKKNRVRKKRGKKGKDSVERSNDLTYDEQNQSEKIKKVSSDKFSSPEEPQREHVDEKKGNNKNKGFFSKIKDSLQTIKRVLTGFKEKIKNVWNLIKALLEKKNMVMLFLRDTDNKAGIKTTILRIIDLLKYCGPQRLEGYIHFGTGDPAGTGQLLSVVAIFYGIYGENIRIEPDFNEKVLEADLFVKGRIRIIRLIVITIRLLRAHEFKQLIKNAKKLKEEL